MKCAATHCCCPELSLVSPCCVCRKGVHHLCSNDVYADATLEKRFCSTDCLHQYLGPPPPVVQDITVRQSGASAVLPADNLSSTPPASRHPNHSCGTNATSSSALPEYDAHGVPVYVEHHSRPNARDAVWSIIHDLAKPYKQSRGRNQSSFTSVCLLCTANSQPASSPSHWEVGLFRDTGEMEFPLIAAMARVWCGRSSTTAFQERVFSTGGLVMSKLRTRTENLRAEKQVILKHNKREIAWLEDKGELYLDE